MMSEEMRSTDMDLGGPFWLGDCRVDPSIGQISNGEQAVKLQPQVMGLLCYLAKRPNTVISRDEIEEANWQATTVGYDALTGAMFKLRKALGDNIKAPRYIETISKRGYRLLISPVPILSSEGAMEGEPTKNATRSDHSLPRPDKPSIAVLPFDNLSADPEQEYFADGIVEDVITALSRFRSLFVIARNSSFTYRGSAVDVRQVARELGVRYVVEGSVRKSGNRVRITSQLIDATSGSHIWADRFDGVSDDLFDLQDQITERIVVAIEPEIQARELEYARRTPPHDLDTWELFQRGLSHYYCFNQKDHAEAIRLFRQTVASDPEFALGHAHLAYALWVSVLYGYIGDAKDTVASARIEVDRAISLDPSEPMARFVSGRLHLVAGDADRAIAEMQTAIALNPNFMLGHYGLGHAFCTGASRPEQALTHFDAALRLGPRGPLRRLPLMIKCAALRQLGRYDEAIAHGREATQFPDCGHLPHMHLAAALAEAGQKREARAELQKARQLQPALSISFILSNHIGPHKSYLKSLTDSLRKAGLPE